MTEYKLGQNVTVSWATFSGDHNDVDGEVRGSFLDTNNSLIYVVLIFNEFKHVPEHQVTSR